MSDSARMDHIVEQLGKSRLEEITSTVDDATLTSLVRSALRVLDVTVVPSGRRDQAREGSTTSADSPVFGGLGRRAKLVRSKSILTDCRKYLFILAR